jgi:hypothetical protein
MLSAVVFGAPTGAVLASVVVTEVRPMAGRWLVSFRPPRTWVEIDQREQPRIAVDLPATVHWNDRSFEGRCSDLSAGGCRLVVPGVSGIARGYRIDIDLDSDERLHRVVGSVVAAHLAHDQVADVLHVKFADPFETGPYETEAAPEIDTVAAIDQEPAPGDG